MVGRIVHVKLCMWDEDLTLSLPRVINFKFPLQPHHKYYITQYGDLAFDSLLRWKMIIPILTTLLTHLSLRRLGECAFLPWEWKVKEGGANTAPVRPSVIELMGITCCDQIESPAQAAFEGCTCAVSLYLAYHPTCKRTAAASIGCGRFVWCKKHKPTFSFPPLCSEGSWSLSGQVICRNLWERNLSGVTRPCFTLHMGWVKRRGRQHCACTDTCATNGSTLLCSQVWNCKTFALVAAVVAAELPL